MPQSPADRARVLEALRHFSIHGAQRLSNKAAAKRRAIEKAKGSTMKKTKTTGETCVGELRLTPLDVGFDLRLSNKVVRIPKCEFRSVGIEQDGETYLIEGTREEMIAAIKKAGYKVKL